jgi:hypothetical protein
VSPQDRTEVAPLDELHDDIGATFVLANVINSNDVRSGERRGRASFTSKRGRKVLVGRDACIDELERYVSVELLVVGSINGRHAAAANLVQDAIATGDLLSDGACFCHDAAALTIRG